MSTPIRIRDALAVIGVEPLDPPPALAAYVPARRRADLIYVSGQVPIDGKAPLATGRVSVEVTVERAAALAERCALQALAAADSVIEPHEGLAGVVRVGGFVAAPAGFADAPAVINGASLFLERVLGDRARHARAAVAVAALPLDVPVEIEFLFEVGVREG